MAFYRGENPAQCKRESIWETAGIGTDCCGGVGESFGDRIYVISPARTIRVTPLWQVTVIAPLSTEMYSLPFSRMYTVNAVPRKPMFAAGVLILKFSVDILPPTNRNTPFTRAIDTAAPVWFGLYTKLSSLSHDVGPID